MGVPKYIRSYEEFKSLMVKNSIFEGADSMRASTQKCEAVVSFNLETWMAG